MYYIIRQKVKKAIGEKGRKYFISCKRYFIFCIWIFSIGQGSDSGPFAEFGTEGCRGPEAGFRCNDMDWIAGIFQQMFRFLNAEPPDIFSGTDLKMAQEHAVESGGIDPESFCNPRNGKRMHDVIAEEVLRPFEEVVRREGVFFRKHHEHLHGFPDDFRNVPAVFGLQKHFDFSCHTEKRFKVGWMDHRFCRQARGRQKIGKKRSSENDGRFLAVETRTAFQQGVLAGMNQADISPLQQELMIPLHDFQFPFQRNFQRQIRIVLMTEPAVFPVRPQNDDRPDGKMERFICRQQIGLSEAG